MALFEDPLSQLIAERCTNNLPRRSGSSPFSAAASNIQTEQLNFPSALETPSAIEFPCDVPDLFECADNFDFSDLLDFQPEEFLQDNSGISSKRKASEILGTDDAKKSRPSSAVLSNLECSYLSHLDPFADSADQSSPSLNLVGSFCQTTESSKSSVEDLSSKGHDYSDLTRPLSPCSDASEQSFCGQSVEYHFQKIQDHVKLAIDALRRGQYERNKSVVTWAHELKNKTFSELKKEAERAWDSDKDKEGAPASKPKPMHGSTKRVEQFRKNMRRWMIGTQAHHIGVEWMVYARMEHLQSISRFILGDALPSDPASPTAVAESIMKYLGRELPLEFVDSELAEPEPGKRYAIGPQLIPELQAKCLRKVPTLAYTMPPDGDEATMASWIAHLKSLFPAKPAPKSKSAGKPSPRQCVSFCT